MLLRSACTWLPAFSVPGFTCNCLLEREVAPATQINRNDNATLTPPQLNPRRTTATHALIAPHQIKPRHRDSLCVLVLPFSSLSFSLSYNDSVRLPISDRHSTATARLTRPSLSCSLSISSTPFNLHSRSQFDCTKPLLQTTQSHYRYGLPTSPRRLHQSRTYRR